MDPEMMQMVGLVDKCIKTVRQLCHIGPEAR